MSVSAFLLLERGLGSKIILTLNAPFTTAAMLNNYSNNNIIYNISSRKIKDLHSITLKQDKNKRH